MRLDASHAARLASYMRTCTPLMSGTCAINAKTLIEDPAAVRRSYDRALHVEVDNCGRCRRNASGVECHVEYFRVLAKTAAHQNTFRSPISAMADGLRVRAGVSTWGMDLRAGLAELESARGAYHASINALRSERRGRRLTRPTRRPMEQQHLAR